MHRLLLLTLTSLALAATPDPEKSLGTPTAPITIDIYSDFQCPGCKLLHDNTLPDLIANYVKPGKVLLIYHDFPNVRHAHARDAARWANAASRVHKYREVADALFRTQTTWMLKGDLRPIVAQALTPAELKTVEPLTHDPAIEEAIDRDVKMGVAAGVPATPTMIVSRKDRTYPLGIVSYQVLKPMLDDLLKK